MRVCRRIFPLPIRGKLFLFFLFAIIVPLLLFGSFLLSSQVRMLEDELSTAAQRELIQMAERVNLEFTHVRSLSNMFYLDEEIVALLREIEAGVTEGERRSAICRQLDQRIALYSTGLNNVRFRAAVIDEGGSVWGNHASDTSLAQLPLAQYDWYQRLEKRPSDIFWVQDAALDQMFSSQDNAQVYLVRKLHERSNWSPLGTLVIAISQADILKMYYGYVGWDQSCYIVDRTGRLISGTDNLELGPLHQTLGERLSSFSGNFTQGGGKSRLLVNHYTISSTQWAIVSFSSLQSRFSRFSGVMQLYFAILTLYLIITLLLSGIMANKFSRPISNLYASILRVKAGDLSVEVPVSTRDEVGEVAAQFNEMLAKIRALMERNLREQKLKRDAEIRSLQTQINPHFLYNTLASIRYLVFAGDKATADTAILSLIRLMKNTLSNAKEFVSVESEMALLKEYIHLQQLAVDQPVELELAVEEAVRDCQTIKLLIQPVVENAFLHGLKPKGRDMALAIRCYAREEKLVFEVQDNGVGFDPDAVTYTNRNLKNRSIGLDNVRSRISLTFGEEYGVQIASRLHEGTIVTLTMPMIKNRGEYSSYEHFGGG